MVCDLWPPHDFSLTPTRMRFLAGAWGNAASTDDGVGQINTLGEGFLVLLGFLAIVE